VYIIKYLLQNFGAENLLLLLQSVSRWRNWSRTRFKVLSNFFFSQLRSCDIMYVVSHLQQTKRRVFIVVCEPLNFEPHHTFLPYFFFKYWHFYITLSWHVLSFLSINNDVICLFTRRMIRIYTIITWLKKKASSRKTT